MCRVRNQHTRPPWTTAYICMTVDESCTDEDGNYVDKPFVVRMVEKRPYSVMEDFPPNSKTPVCATCKKTNRTRAFCRDRHKHRKLPWCTVYVLLSTQESADPSTIVAEPSRKINIAQDIEVENNKGKMNASTPPSGAKESLAEVRIENHQSIGTTSTNKNDESVQKSSICGGDDINNIPESRTMLIQINDEETTISWLQLLREDDSITKGSWVPQVSTQQPKCIPTGTALIHSSRVGETSFPPVAPATDRIQKRDVESTIPIDASHDIYRQHAMGRYTTATGQPLAPALPHPYPYHAVAASMPKHAQTPPQYSSHIWPYPTAAIPSQQHQNILHPYATAQRRPISPTAIGSPGGYIIGASSPSASVTAGEAAAMRRKKPRRDFESEDNSDSHPHPSPPPPPPAPIVPQLHHPPVSYGQVPLVPVPPPLHQQLQQPSDQIHQDRQPWFVYQQMYQAQLQPLKPSYTNEPSPMAVRTPESTPRDFHPHDESPNNVTMTPGPGDGGGDHDSDDNDFNRASVL